MRKRIRYFIILVMLAPTGVSAFPEMIRHGYPGCGSCHVSPAGGGALNEYGRAQAGQLMSTISYEGGENPLYGLLVPPKWMSIGGDARFVNYTVKTEGFEFTRMFMMQRDIEVAFHLGDTITVGGSYGLYGEEQKPEQRRSYVGINFTESLRVRLGRFIPTYGTLQPDHTVSTRSGLGLGQGEETYNAELSYSGKRGEIFLTGVGGRSVHLSMGDADGYSTRSDDYSGGVGSASLFLGKSAKLGISGMALSALNHTRIAYGVNLLWGITTRLYLLAELDRLREDSVDSQVYNGKLGLEVFRGIHASYIVDGTDGKKTNGWQLQLFPLVHWEVVAQLTQTKTPQGTASTSLLLFHTYL